VLGFDINVGFQNSKSCQRNSKCIYARYSRAHKDVDRERRKETPYTICLWN